MILVDRAPDWTYWRPRYRVVCFHCMRVLFRRGFPSDVRKRRECKSCAAKHRWRTMGRAARPPVHPLWLRAAMAFGRSVRP